MKIICTIAIITAFIGLFYFCVLKIKKEIEREKKTFRNSGVLRQAEDCRRPKEYLCIKCGDCGRIFINDKTN